jgi:hypothetical protein
MAAFKNPFHEVCAKNSRLRDGFSPPGGDVWNNFFYLLPQIAMPIYHSLQLFNGQERQFGFLLQ